MNSLTQVLDHLGLFAEQHMPADWIAKGVPLSILLLLMGIGLCVLGAKLARFGMTGAFVIAGGAIGAHFAEITGLALPLCMLIGAAMVGTIAHLTFRLWVGVLAAVVLSSLALGVFGYQRVLPHLGEFDNQVALPHVDGLAGFTLPSPEQQQAYRGRSPQQWAEEFWGFVAEKDQRVPRQAQAIGLVALVAGLLFGLVASRATLILSTALLGTSLVVTAVVTLLSNCIPGCYQALLSRPGLSGIAIGGFLVTSLAVQTVLTRKARVSATKPSEKP